ncbi:MAG: cyclic nucleotide-binding domain-containing protein [Nitrospirae bacterium]|nr:cyclic nucleotide-binding domain-containing protein [Nitrospirota bacterium]MBF0541234.1 cyclic nucleotide-binding domain-containing protein [Nitrospirota bacterium]
MISARIIGLTESYKAGKVIFKEGTFGEGTYVVIEGQIEISKMVNNDKIIIAKLGKGDIFGEMSYLDRGPRSAHVMAITDVTVGLLNKDLLEEEINKTAEYFMVIIKAIVKRLRNTTLELVSLKEQCARNIKKN